MRGHISSFSRVVNLHLMLMYRVAKGVNYSIPLIVMAFDYKLYIIIRLRYKYINLQVHSRRKLIHFKYIYQYRHNMLNVKPIFFLSTSELRALQAWYKQQSTNVK